jgi:hypothetical protein
MKSPATSGSTDHDTCFNTGIGDWRPITSTMTVTTVPATKIGSPRSRPKADAPSNTTAVSTMPPASLGGLRATLELPATDSLTPPLLS